MKKHPYFHLELRRQARIGRAHISKDGGRKYIIFNNKATNEKCKTAVGHTCIIQPKLNWYSRVGNFWSKWAKFEAKLLIFLKTK